MLRQHQPYDSWLACTLHIENLSARYQTPRPKPLIWIPASGFHALAAWLCRYKIFPGSLIQPFQQ